MDSELNAEIIALEKEQQLRWQIQSAGTTLNELVQKIRVLALIIHRQGLELNRLEGSPKYAAGDLGGVPEFRTQGRNYSLMSQPISLAQYKDAPALTEIIGSETPSPERQTAYELERDRLVLCGEIAKAERRLHLALVSQDKKQWAPLDGLVSKKKAELRSLNQQLAQLKN